MRNSERGRCLRPTRFFGVASQLNDLAKVSKKGRSVDLHECETNNEDTGRTDTLDNSGNTHDPIALRKHQKQLGEDQCY